MVDIQKYIKQKHKIKGLIHLCQLNNFPTAEFIFVDDQLNYPIDKIFVLNEWNKITKRWKRLMQFFTYDAECDFAVNLEGNEDLIDFILNIKLKRLKLQLDNYRRC